MPTGKIRLARGTLASKPATLLQGEPYFATDAEALYIGNGDGSDVICGIVESGSNANGKYIKHADGTMIQIMSVGFTTVISESQVSGTVTLPQSFYDTSYRWVACQSVEHGTTAFACIVWGQTTGKTVSTFGIIGKSVGTFDAVASVGASIIAIGRWKA